MSDGGGEGVGGVIWLGFLFEIKMKFYHLLHLGFIGGAVAGESLFNFVRGIFVNWELMLFGDE